MKSHKGGTFYLHSWSRIGLVMALPGLVFVLFFTVIPFLMNVGYAFTTYNFNSTVIRFNGLNNFIFLFNDRDFWLVFGNTLKLVFLYTVVINAFAILLAVMLSKVGKRLGNIVRTTLYYPQLLSLVVVGFLFRIILDYNYGPVNGLLQLLGVPKGSLPHWLGAPNLVIPSISIALVWLCVGYFTTIYYAGVMNIPTEYYEVSKIEGASGFQELFKVTLPFLAPAVTICTVMLTVESFNVFAVPISMTAGGPGRYGTTLALWAYNSYFGMHQYGKALSISVLLGLMALCVALIELKVLLRQEVDK